MSDVLFGQLSDDVGFSVNCDADRPVQLFRKGNREKRIPDEVINLSPSEVKNLLIMGDKMLDRAKRLQRERLLEYRERQKTKLAELMERVREAQLHLDETNRQIAKGFV